MISEIVAFIAVSILTVCLIFFAILLVVDKADKHEADL